MLRDTNHRFIYSGSNGRRGCERPPEGCLRAPAQHHGCPSAHGCCGSPFQRLFDCSSQKKKTEKTGRTVRRPIRRPRRRQPAWPSGHSAAAPQPRVVPPGAGVTLGVHLTPAPATLPIHPTAAFGGRSPPLVTCAMEHRAQGVPHHRGSPIGGGAAVLRHCATAVFGFARSRGMPPTAAFSRGPQPVQSTAPPPLPSDE